MKTPSLALAALLATVSLAACGRKTEAPAMPPAPAPAAVPAANNDMAGMAMAPADKMAKGVGVVTAMDKAAGTITLAHEPIPEAGWPAMTMGFKITPPLLNGIAVGDKVAFDLKLHDGAGEVTSIAKR
ncbi:copper-binding protein [uncultured Caulobacter sp.]|uniref:copper-binding protein n=1 Tax=uncultured Caulobacter sp. TaxID=158749 RepID=UPI002629A134|nr:copper-binding protein [uncultured Caulobacter sp.]